MNTNNGHILPNNAAARPVYNLTPFTLLDYPDKTACIVWFAGCNMRCQYCYNPDIVFGKGKRTYAEVLQFLSGRKGLLDAVVLSGGECTLHKGLSQFIRKIKEMGFFVKLDTNGTNPQLIQKLIADNLLDFVSLDFKATQAKYVRVCEADVFHDFNHTLSSLLSSDVPFEVRTTVHSKLLTRNDLLEMADYLLERGYRNTYFIQYYRHCEQTVGCTENSEYNYLAALQKQTPLPLTFRNNGIG